MLTPSEVKAASPEQLDIDRLQPGKNYGKRHLAQLWGYTPRTVYRWHTVALRYAPGYYDGFQGTRILATCEECGGVTPITDLTRIRLKRPSFKFSCPHCQGEKKPTVKVQQFTRKYVHLNTTQARVLRLVGGLIQRHGSTRAQEILTTCPHHKRLRSFLKHINLGIPS